MSKNMTLKLWLAFSNDFLVMFIDVDQVHQLPGFWNICCCQFYRLFLSLYVLFLCSSYLFVFGLAFAQTFLELKNMAFRPQPLLRALCKII